MFIRLKTQNTKFALSTLAFCIASTMVNAQADSTDVERIIVTSDLANRGLEELAASATILTPDTLEVKQARHLEDALSVAPNTNFASGASRGKFIQIRGIGERSQFSEPVNPSVALVLDDVDFSGIGSLATLFDVAQVEVLAGPQSTATGASGLAGMIKLVSVQPSSEPEGKFELSIAEFNTYQVAGAYSSAVTDSVNARVAVQKVESDGFVENAFLDREDTNNIDELTARLSFDVFFDDDLMAKLRLYHFNIDNGYDAFSLDNDNVTQSDEPGRDVNEANVASVSLIKNFNTGDLSVTLANLDSKSEYGYDEDWTFVGFHPDGYQSTDIYFRDIETQSADVKFNADNWVLGLYARSTDENLLREYTFNSQDFNSSYEPASIAVYGEYQFQLQSELEITAGIRVEQFEADYQDVTGFTEKLDDSLLAGKISVSYPVANNKLFASVSRGYKAGGFNPDERVAQEDRLFDPEYNWNYEMGIRGQLNEDKANLALTFFYMKRKDAQVNDFSVIPREDGSGAVEFIDVIGNADTGTNKGIELQSNWTISDYLSLTANLGYLDATFGNYTRVDGTFVPKQEQAQAPRWTFYLASNVNVFENVVWTLEFEGKDEFRFSDGHNERAPFTPMLNTEIRYDYGNWAAKLWLKNALDRLVYTRGFGGFSNDPRDGYFPAEPYYQFGQERQLGASLIYSF